MENLVVDDLTKTYGATRALDSMAFHVRPGEVFGFVGANGAGKSTTMRIIAGVLAADSGSVLRGERPLDRAARRRLGVMPEERGLYPKMPVGGQLTYFGRLHGMSKGDAAKRARHWCESLDVAQHWSKEVQSLSLGNQQRVQLAAALVHDPEVLVLDEPFSGLDPVAVDVMSEVLTSQARAGVPVLFSSHQLDLVERLCDRVGVAARGRIVAQGSVEELTRTSHERLVVVGAPVEHWVAEIGDVHVVSATRVDPSTSRTTLEAEHLDDQVVLRAALAAGPVHSLERPRTPLSDVFRDVVADPPSSTSPSTARGTEVPA
jgi:ABC-2 type transport system ATP-binding protein